MAGTPGPGRGARSARAGGWPRPLALERLPVHVDLEKSKLRFRAGSPAWPSKVRAPFPACAPAQGARASAGQFAGPGRAGAPADLAPKPSRPASLGSVPARLPHSAAPPSAPPPPQTSRLGKMRSLGSCFRKIKFPLQLYWIKAKLNLGYSHVCYRGRGIFRKNLLVVRGATGHEGVDKRQNIKQP